MFKVVFSKLSIVLKLNRVHKLHRKGGWLTFGVPIHYYRINWSNQLPTFRVKLPFNLETAIKRMVIIWPKEYHTPDNQGKRIRKYFEACAEIERKIDAAGLRNYRRNDLLARTSFAQSICMSMYDIGDVDGDNFESRYFVPSVKLYTDTRKRARISSNFDNKSVSSSYRKIPSYLKNHVVGFTARDFLEKELAAYYDFLVAAFQHYDLT